MMNRQKALGTRQKGRTNHPIAYCLLPIACHASRGFTLIETMVAISLLTIAIVAPMSLTMQSLGSAYYARDQITAYYLAQEAIETVRHARDANVLKIALGDTGVGVLDGIPSGSFTVDTTKNDAMTPCSPCTAPLLKSPEGLYNYQSGTPTNFIRTVTATVVAVNGNTGQADEIKIAVTVSWQTESLRARTFTISENLYRWVKDDSGVL